jgi:phospholipid N-methyltransferase
MHRKIQQYSAFFREFGRTSETTGALNPSGPLLAKKLVDQFSRRTGPRRILEVGPGTGAVTREIIRYLDRDDSLHLVELNARFVEVLRRRFSTEREFRRVAEQTQIFHLPVEELDVPEPYDHIVCGIPFNNLAPDLVDKIFAHLVGSLREGGTLSFFEYLWVRPIRMLTPSRDERQRIAEVGSVLRNYLKQYERRHDKVYLNVLPAVAHHLRVPGNAEWGKRHAAIAD